MFPACSNCNNGRFPLKNGSAHWDIWKSHQAAGLRWLYAPSFNVSNRGWWTCACLMSLFVPDHLLVARWHRNRSAAVDAVSLRQVKYKLWWMRWWQGHCDSTLKLPDGEEWNTRSLFTAPGQSRRWGLVWTLSEFWQLVFSIRTQQLRSCMCTILDHYDTQNRVGKK